MSDLVMDIADPAAGPEDVNVDMPAVNETAETAASGPSALAIVLGMLGLPADAETMRHQAGTTAAWSSTDMLRSLRGFPVKAKIVTTGVSRLQKASLPAIAATRSGGWVVIGRLSGDQIVMMTPAKRTPELVDIDAFAALWDGRLLLITRRAGLGHLATRFGLGWFVNAVIKYRKPLTEVLLFSFFLQLFGLLAPIFFQIVVDKVLVHRGLSTLEVLAIGLGLLSLFEVLLSGIRTWLFAHTTSRIDIELGARVYRHLMALPMSYFGARRIGDTVARVRELDTIRQFLTSSGLTLVLDLVFALVFSGVLIAYSPTLSLIVAAALPFYVVLSLVATPMFRQRIEEKFRRGAENQALLVESVSGAETVKAMALEPVLQRRWEEQLAAYVLSSLRVVSLGAWTQQIIQAINKIVSIGILFFGAREVIVGNLTVGELVAFNMLSGQVTQPVLRLAQLWQDFQQARVSVERLGDILNTSPEPQASGQTNLPAIQGHIQISHVTFRYRLNTPATLTDVKLDVPAGQTLGIVGASGSGKSTLVKLVQRLYVPEAGQVTVDGTDLALANPFWLRRQLGVVLQDNVLFNASVRENIAISNPGMAMDDVIRAARLAGAHDFILGLPEGYDTSVGERGATLSGGQRQRVAIARALASNPRILIFDEATSALDYESEAAIQQNMVEICHGRTVLIVAHRLSTVRAADRIVVMEEGRVVEDGSHEQLLRLGQRYARLWKIQNDGPTTTKRGRPDAA